MKQLNTVTLPADMGRLRLAGFVMILGALTAFSAMSIDMYLPAFPQISRDLGIPLSTVQLSVSAFLFGSAFGQLFYGPLADSWGRRPPLLLGLSLYVVSNVGCAMIHSGGELLFWRVMMAVGGGAGMVISRAMVRDLYDTTEAARMFSLLMLIMGIAPILAPLAGGQLLLITGWRGIFLFLAVFGFLSLVGSAVALPESLPAANRHRRSMKEMVKVYGHLLKNRHYLRYGIALGCVAGVNFAYISGAPFVFIELHGVSPQHFGLFFGFNAFGLIASSQLNRWLLRRYPPQKIALAAFIVIAVSATLLTVAAVTGIGGFASQAVFIFICLCMTGFLYPNLTALAMAPFDKAAGSASALLGTIQYTLGASGGALVGLLHNGTAVPMTATMLSCGAVGLCAVIAQEKSHHPR